MANPSAGILAGSRPPRAASPLLSRLGALGSWGDRRHRPTLNVGRIFSAAADLRPLAKLAAHSAIIILLGKWDWRVTRSGSGFRAHPSLVDGVKPHQAERDCACEKTASVHTVSSSASNCATRVPLRSSKHWTPMLFQQMTTLVWSTCDQ